MQCCRCCVETSLVSGGAAAADVGAVNCVGGTAIDTLFPSGDPVVEAISTVSLGSGQPSKPSLVSTNDALL